MTCAELFQCQKVVPLSTGASVNKGTTFDKYKLGIRNHDVTRHRAALRVWPGLIGHRRVHPLRCSRVEVLAPRYSTGGKDSAQRVSRNRSAGALNAKVDDSRSS